MCCKLDALRNDIPVCWQASKAVARPKKAGMKLPTNKWCRSIVDMPLALARERRSGDMFLMDVAQKTFT